MKVLISFYLVLFSLQSFASEINQNYGERKINSLKTLQTDYLSNKKVILRGFENDFIQVEMEVFSPILVKKMKERKYPFATQYKLSVLNVEHEVIYQVPLGDPFHVYAQHFGYEGKKSILPIKNPYIEVPLPVLIDPTFIRLDAVNGKQLKLGDELQIYIR